ncbi:IS1634 family transposase, partial [Mycoplasma sp. AC157]
MFFNDFKVKLPIKNAKISRQKNVKYVQLVIESKYDKVKKYQVDKKVLIGKATEDEKFLIPNDNYFNYFGEETLIEVESEQKFSESMSIGQYFVYQFVFKKLGIDSILKNMYGVKSDLLQGLACFYSLDSNSTSQGFLDWTFDNYIKLQKQYSLASISKFITNDITNQNINDFSFQWINKSKELFHLKNKDVYLNIDSTNVATEAKNIEMAEYGYSKNNKSEPIVNINMIVEQSTGIPVFHEVYSGSITDQSQCISLMEKANSFELRKHIFVLDRGYFSSKNLDFIVENDFQFIMMARTWNKQLREIISRKKNEIIDQYN